MLKRFVEIRGLTNLIGNKDGVLVNTLGQVKDSYGNDLPTDLDDDGYPVIKTTAWDGFRIYRVADLMAIQFKSLQLHASDLGKVIAFNIDGNKQNLRADNIGYRFSGGKLEVRGLPGFYHVPGYTRYAINIEGELRDTHDGRVVNWYVTKPYPKKNITGGYYFFRPWFSRNKNGSIGRHRALCLVFKDYPDNVDDLVTNHLDGVPGNDTLDNLEIVTKGKNNEHAWKNNLRTQNQRVLSRDVLTGVVTEHLSMVRAASDLGYGGSDTIRTRILNKPFGTVFHDGKQFKLKGDPRDWVIPEDPVKAIEEAKLVSGLSLAVMVRDCRTLLETTYESAGEAGKATRIDNGTIGYRLRKGDLSPLFGYQFKLVSDIRPFPDFTKEDLEKSLIPTNFKVVARNLLTGEEREFDSVKLAAAFTGETALQIRLKNGDQPVYSSGWQCKYSTDEWTEIDDPEETVYRANTTITARDEVTGDIIVASSSRKLGTKLGLNSQEIRKAAYTKGKQLYKGYRFRLGDSDAPWPVV